MNFGFDVGAILVAVIAAVVTALGLLFKLVRTIDKLSMSVGQLVSKITVHDSDLDSLRDWALKQGYDRRK